MSQKVNEEIDLVYLYAKVKEGYRNLLVSTYRWILFFLKHWIVLLLVIATALILGYFWEKDTVKSKETTLIVQVNFDAVNYVYDAVSQLPKKINEGDKNALLSMKDDFDELFKIANVTIEPIPDVITMAEGLDPYSRSVEVFLDLSKYEEDLLLSEMFVQEYKLHKITLTTTEEATNKAVNVLIKYLNSDNKYVSLKDIYVKNTQTEIAASKQNISAIDSILTVYGSKANVPGRSSQIYLNTANNGNIHLLTEQKIDLINEIEELETELVKYNDGIVSLLNKPMLAKKKSFKDKKMLLLTIFFIFFYVLTVLVVHFFMRVGKMSRERDN